MSTVVIVSEEFESFVVAAGAAFADQLRRELGEWLPTLDSEELGRWAAAEVIRRPSARQSGGDEPRVTG